jgi:hypothetical protein
MHHEPLRIEDRPVRQKKGVRERRSRAQRSAAHRKPGVINIWMPVYNEEAHLEAALDSVLGQTHAEFRFLISNNHSTDRSTEILSRASGQDSRIQLFSPPRHLPGMEHGKFMSDEVLPTEPATYSIFMGGHDVWDRNLLHVLFERAESEPGCAIAYTDSFEMDGAGNVLRRYEGIFQTKEVPRPFIPIQVLLSLSHNLIWGGLWRESMRRAVHVRHPCSSADHLMLAEVALLGSIVYQSGSAVFLRAAKNAGDWTTYVQKHIPASIRRYPILDMLNQLEWCGYLIDRSTEGSGFAQEPLRNLLKNALQSAYLLRYVDNFQGHPGAVEAFFAHPKIQHFIRSNTVSCNILQGLLETRNEDYPDAYTSRDAGPTGDAMAPEVRGNGGDALAAAAEALRLSPDDAAALTRLAALVGNRFRQRAIRDGDGALSIVFCAPGDKAADAQTAQPDGLGDAESAMAHLAAALAGRGHRVVVLNDCASPGRFDDVEYARWETLPTRCLADRPDVLVAVRSWQTLGRVRLAPLQIVWTDATSDRPSVEHLGDVPARTEIDFFILQSDSQADTFNAHYHVPLCQIIRMTPHAVASTVDRPARASTPDPWPAVAGEWEVICRAALADEPAVVERIAVHLSAGRFELAQRMAEREPPPDGVTEAWDAMRAFTAWRAGSGDAPSQDTLRRVALHFKSLRGATRCLPLL